MPRLVRIHGERGRWLAEVEGRWLAVLHSTWRRGPTGYRDPMVGVKTDGARYQEFLAALRSCDLVVVQRDRKGSLDRDGYVGVFKFKDLVVEEEGPISLTITERYADPKRG